MTAGTYADYLREPVRAQPLRPDASTLRSPLGPRPYGHPCCGTAYPSVDPLPRLSVVLQYFRMHVNIRALAQWKSQCADAVELIVNVDSRAPQDNRRHVLGTPLCPRRV